jgi:hypothetical protein
LQAAAGEQRHEGGVDVAAVVAAHGEPVFSADDLAAQVQLGDVVVHGQASVVEETAERDSLVSCVADPLRHGRLVDDSVGFAVTPFEKASMMGTARAWRISRRLFAGVLSIDRSRAKSAPIQASAVFARSGSDSSALKK